MYNSGVLKFTIVLLLILSLLSSLPIDAQVDRGAGVKSKDVQSSSEKRLALVIGNSTYLNTTPLENPANDATDMAVALKELGFEVISGTNQTLPQMRKLIREFGAKLQAQKGVGLFYFAGHGIQFAGKNFLIPVDAQIESEVETEDAGVDLNTILRQMDSANNGFNMVILDACRNNPFARSWRGYRDTGNAGGLARIDAPTGTLIAYATKPGETASDGAGKNGLYTSALLKQMRVKNVDVTKMFQRVRAEVIAESKGKQVPFDESSVVGDFYFGGTSAVTAVNESNSSLNSKEELFWNSISNSNDAEEFQDYLLRSESGEFSGSYKSIAELKVYRLKKVNAATVWLKLKETAKLLTKYDKVYLLDNDVTIVQTGKNRAAKYGLINKNGKEITPLKYTDIEPFSDNIAMVKIDSVNDPGATKYGFIDKSGKEITPLKYDYAEPFSGGLALVATGTFDTGSFTGKYGFINKTGKEVLPLKYDSANSFSQGLALVGISNGKTEKLSFINDEGEMIISLKYSEAKSFSENFALVKKESGEYAFINKTGEEVITLDYDEVDSFYNGLASVKKIEMSANETDEPKEIDGFIDYTGKETIPLKYSDVTPFNKGLARVAIKNAQTYKFGFIDRSGKEIIPIKYAFAQANFDGLITVGIGDYTNSDFIGKYGVLDNTGKQLIPFKYDRPILFSEELAVVRMSIKKAYKHGVIDKKGKELIPIKYDDIWCYAFNKEGIFGVTINDRKGFVDIYGNEYFDF